MFMLLQIPTYGIFENINSLSELAAMPQWTEERPLRVVTGYTYVRKTSNLVVYRKAFVFPVID